MTLKTDFKIQLGTIDSGYEGGVGIIVYNADVRNLNKAAWISAGTKIAQLVISPIVTPTVDIVEEFETASERGENGFGSSDMTLDERIDAMSAWAAAQNKAGEDPGNY